MAEDWRSILDAETNPLAPLVAALFKALEMNPRAIAAGSDDAPIGASGWHPYDAAAYGDGADGIIYDSAVDGSVATITSPDFADGYEYRFIGQGLNLQGTDLIQIDLYRATSAAYAGYQTLVTYTSASRTGVFDVSCPFRVTIGTHIVAGSGGPVAIGNSASDGILPVSLAWNHNTAQKILRARFRNDSRNINSGTIRMYRRLLP